MKRNRILLVSALAAAALLGARPAARAEGAPAPRIECWVSILPQAFLVDRVGGDRVDVTVMVGPGQVPHTYEPTARQLAGLASARVYFSVGVAFEEALVPRIERNFRSVTIADMADGIERRLESGHPGDGPKTPADGDPRHPAAASGAHAHGGFDPHVWLSPRNAALMARNTRDALASADPGGAETYRANCESLVADLEKADAELSRILSPFRGREIFVFHPAYGYFTDAYGLIQIAIEENGAAPGPKHLAEVIDRARGQGATAVFVQPQVSASYAETVAKEIGAKVVALDPLSEDYIVNLDSMAREIVRALEQARSR